MNKQKVSRRDIDNYFNYNDEWYYELTTKFINAIENNGFDSTVSDILAYAVKAWVKAEPGSESAHASKFVNYLLNNNE